MEIGRKSISDEDFAKIWGELYQEFYNLTSSNKCDASIVYNAIYIICTSDSNLEEKLYWKIGDFFYNRCKIHKDKILQAIDYLGEYILQFKEYSRLVNSIDTLGSFLNSCVKGRKLDDFGYLLWERMIIQNLNESFFDDAYDYSDTNKHVILDSFSRIIPDNTQPLLYYREKYEKNAINKIKRKYRITEIISIEDFCNNLKLTVHFENFSMKSSFLAVSYESVLSALEECFLSSKYYEIFYNLIEYINLNNLVNLSKGIRHKEIKSSFNSGKLEGFQYQVSFVENMVITDESMKKSVFPYQKIPSSEYENLRNFLESDPSIQKTLSLVQGILDKRKENNNLCEDKDFNNSLNPPFNHRTDSANIFKNLLQSFSLLNATYRLLKKSYACYVCNTIKCHLNILESNIENIVNFYNSLCIFEDNDFKQILLIIFRDYLQRAKPCYMKRLCDFTSFVYVEDNEVKINELKPFSLESLSIFKLAISLVFDKREFLNLYQETLKNRLLSKSVIPLKELRILRMLEVPAEDKLYKMIGEMESLSSNFKVLNSLYWNIEPQFPNLPLPLELIQEINIKRPDIQTIITDNQSSQGYQNKKDLLNVKLRIKNTGNENKIINLAHQYSVIELSINSHRVILNIYQYLIICILMKESASLDQIIQKLNDFPENVLRKFINSLISNKFIDFNKGIYSIDCSNIVDGDYSTIQYDSEPETDICIESYLQTIGAKILKVKKEIETKTLILEIKENSKIEVSNKIVEATVRKLIEKGLAEAKGDILEFVP